MTTLSPPLSRRDRKHAAAMTAAATPVEAAAPEAPAPAWDALPNRGYVPAPQRSLLRALQFYGPRIAGAPSTTAQTEVLNTAVIAAPTDAEGILVGRDLISRTPVAHDPFTAYKKGLIDSPNVVILGDVGTGKSSLLKTCYVVRPMVLKNRRVVVVDKKLQQRSDGTAEGEYAALARSVGVEPIRLRLDGEGSRLNILDPLLLGGGDRGATGQYEILHAAAVLANDGHKLTAWEGKALRVAHKRALIAAEGKARTPVLADVVELLGNVDTDMFGQLSAESREKMHISGTTVRYVLDRLLSEMGALFDGETSRNISLHDKLTVFDISDLPDSGPSISLAMMITNMWLLGTMRADPGKPTNFNTDEGWHLVGGAAGEQVKARAKLSRGLGLSNVVAMHHISDIPADDPAVAFIKEARTVHLYAQATADEALHSAQLFNLKPGAEHALMALEKGVHLLKIGSNAEIRTEHVRSRWEVEITNTDSAITGSDPRL